MIAVLRLEPLAAGVFRASWRDPELGQGDALVALAGRAGARWCGVADVVVPPGSAVDRAVRSYVEGLRRDGGR